MRKTICFQLISLIHLSLIFSYFIFCTFDCARSFNLNKQESRQASEWVREYSGKNKKTSKREKWNLFLFILFRVFSCMCCANRKMSGNSISKYFYRLLFIFFSTYNSKYFGTIFVFGVLFHSSICFVPFCCFELFLAKMNRPFVVVLDTFGISIDFLSTRKFFLSFNLYELW